MTFDVFAIQDVGELVTGLVGDTVPSPAAAGSDGRAEFMSRSLLAKRFRKSRPEPGVADRIRLVTARVTRRRRPLRLLVPFGGYKSPASVEAPYAGWAELFAAVGLCELAARLCAVHEPGVVVEFSSDAAVVPLLTGAEPAALGAYAADFDTVLRTVSASVPENLVLRQTGLHEHYDVIDLHRRIREDGARLRDRWYPRLPVDDRARLLRGAAHNDHRPRHGTATTPEVLTRSVCDHQAFLEIDGRERSPVLHRWDTVPIALRKGIPGWLHLGSNRRSATQFWMGTGVLDQAGARPAAHIIPPGRAREAAPLLPRHTLVDPPVAGLRHLPVVTASPPSLRSTLLSRKEPR